MRLAIGRGGGYDAHQPEGTGPQLTGIMSRKRDVIEQFKREELQDLAAFYELEVPDRRVREDLVAALSRSRRAVLTDMLATLSRDRLKELCLALDLDDGGREKALIIERLSGEPVAEDDAEESGDGEAPTKLLVRLLAPSLRIFRAGTSWPALAQYVSVSGELPMAIYARMVGGSSRGNAQERRFQNPGQRTPIVSDPEAHALLLGLWTEQGEERAVIVAMDAYRRVDRATRFSLFMPLSLLETAADTGFATHENNKGEVLYAFRPENFEKRYLPRFLEEAPALAGPSAPKTIPAPAPESMEGKRESPRVYPDVETSELYIRPQVGMYAAFARLNYKPWFALAEFLDNSIQSFLHHRESLIAAGHDGPLVIDVTIDDNEISVLDRAGGIAWRDFPRAFSPAAPPEDASGLSEFGLGMKAAACWFAKRWTVTTSALGEEVQRAVTFDVPKISREGVENLPIETRVARVGDHYTQVTMRDLRVRPRGSTLRKIKDHLAGIYRVLTAEGIVRIRFTASGKSEDLVYHPPELLTASYYREPDDPPVLWRKDFVYDLHDRRVHGWAGIMAVGAYARAGFSVFRRRRLIEGSVDSLYKPHVIFGSPNSFIAQRVVGEIYVEGFNVTHTKDGIQWDGYEDEVLLAIQRELDKAPLPLLDQAAGYRARKRGITLPASFGAEAMDATASELSQPEAIAVLQVDPQVPLDEALRDEPPHVPDPAVPPPRTRTITMHVRRDGQPWQIDLELVRDPALPFYSTSVVSRDGKDVIGVQLNLEHELSVRHINDNEQALQPLVRLLAALALAEKQARDAGVKHVGTVRRYANEILSAMTHGGG